MIVHVEQMAVRLADAAIGSIALAVMIGQAERRRMAPWIYAKHRFFIDLVNARRVAAGKRKRVFPYRRFLMERARAEALATEATKGMISELDERIALLRREIVP